MSTITNIPNAVLALAGIIKALCATWGLDYAEVMAELAKRHEIDGSAFDAAAARMDEQFP